MTFGCRGILERWFYSRPRVRKHFLVCCVLYVEFVDRVVTVYMPRRSGGKPCGPTDKV